MLSKYKSGQPVIYNILNNEIKNNKVSHAYLFDSNDNSEVMDIVLCFAKMILCNDRKDLKENICQRIDSGNYVDVKIIEPDGLWIKKNQLLDLQSEFNKKSFEGGKKIYIIKDAEKMNTQTANSILKFLEEPVDDIIAILIVNNINLVLPTITSRCQVLKLNKKIYSKTSIDNFYNLFNNSNLLNLSVNDVNKFIEDVISFTLFIEEYKLDTIIYSKKYWHDKFKDRENNIMAIELLFNLYYDAVKYKANLDCEFYYDKKDVIRKISDNNELDKLIKKIIIIDNVKNNLRKNMNINLLIDKMIIEMCGEFNEVSRC